MDLLSVPKYKGETDWAMIALYIVFVLVGIPVGLIIIIGAWIMAYNMILDLLATL